MKRESWKISECSREDFAKNMTEYKSLCASDSKRNTFYVFKVACNLILIKILYDACVVLSSVFIDVY